MRHACFAGLIGTVVGLALHAAAQVRAIDAERLLTGRFGFTAAEVAQARSGQAIAKMLPSQDAVDIGVFGAVRIDATADRLVYWLKQVATFRKAAELGLSRRLSNPPQIGDFADLSLDANELSALRACRPGNCDLMIGDKAIQRFQSEVNWAASDAAARATLLTRQLLLGHAQAYLTGGDQALGASHDDKAPRVLADEFHQVLWQSKGLYDLAPPFAAYLEGFPTAPAPEVGAVPVLGEGWRRPGGVDLAAPVGRLSRACGRGLRRGQAALCEPLRRRRPHRRVAGVRAGRQGLLRARRRARPVHDAARDGGATAARAEWRASRATRRRCTWTGSGGAWRYRDLVIW